ncbi:MAG: phage holin family protein [Oscillospiraceae bacterium]
MKENIFKVLISAIGASVAIYSQKIMLPIIVLCVVMALDYATGLISARVNNQINSRIGIVGIVKKICYLLVVFVAISLDWVIITVAQTLNITLGTTLLFGIVVCIWLIINELISILENLTKIGVPMPTFLLKIVGKLKTSVEQKIHLESESEVNEN